MGARTGDARTVPLSSFSGPGVKKLVLKNFTVPNQLPSDFEADSWDLLKAAVRAIHTKTLISTSLERLYSAVDNLCAHHKGASLYDRLKVLCDDHIKTEIQKLSNSQTLEGHIFLEHVDSAWTVHCDQMVFIRSIFLSLDRTYALQTQGVDTIWDMGMHAFGKHLQAAHVLLPQIVKGVLALLLQNRLGEMIDRGLIKRLVAMLSTMQLYKTFFEQKFLDATKEFFWQRGT